MTTTQRASERRKDVRLDHTLPLKLCTDMADFVTETKNLSCSGAYCKVTKYVEPMTKLKIHLLLPIRRNGKVSNKKITCSGVVVRSESNPADESFNAAIFFNEILPKDVRSIKDFIESMADENK